MFVVVFTILFAQEERKRTKMRIEGRKGKDDPKRKDRKEEKGHTLVGWLVVCTHFFLAFVCAALKNYSSIVNTTPFSISYAINSINTLICIGNIVQHQKNNT